MLGLDVHVGVVLPDARHLDHVGQGFRRITLQHTDLDACVCVCERSDTKIKA